MKPNLIVNGAGGRMGRRILALAIESGHFDIVGAIERPQHPDLGKDAGVLAGLGRINLTLESEPPDSADVMIDFSLPEATDRVVSHCTENNIALVIGTTGLGPDQLGRIRDAAARIAVIQTTNMSVGMNILFSIVGKVAAMAGQEYDIEIVEAHHRFKKDSPSGTALTLAENIARETGRSFPDCLVHGRHGVNTPRRKDTIGMHAIRAGDITGEHSVILSTLGETITLSHSAHNRDNFVRGALRAALWLSGKGPGMYSMQDVMGI